MAKIAPVPVLVVDDEAGMLDFYRRFFAAHKAEGFAAEFAADAEAALAALNRRPFELAVLDWSLPGISGLQLARALRAAPSTRGMGILMVTGKGAPRDVLSGLDVGADDYLPKPFDERVLLAHLWALRSRRQQGRADKSKS